MEGDAVLSASASARLKLASVHGAGARSISPSDPCARKSGESRASSREKLADASSTAGGHALLVWQARHAEACTGEGKPRHAGARTREEGDHTRTGEDGGKLWSLPNKDKISRVRTQPPPMASDALQVQFLPGLPLPKGWQRIRLNDGLSYFIE